MSRLLLDPIHASPAHEPTPPTPGQGAPGPVVAAGPGCELWDDERTRALVDRFNDCEPGREHVYLAEHGELRCMYCRKEFVA